MDPHMDPVYWRTYCKCFCVAKEQESAFVRDTALTLSDIRHYGTAHFEKCQRIIDLVAAKRAREETLAVFDAAVPGLLADSVGRDLDVAGAARMLAQQRLVLAARVAACASACETVTILAGYDLQLLHAADRAGDRMYVTTCMRRDGSMTR